METGPRPEHLSGPLCGTHCSVFPVHSSSVTWREGGSDPAVSLHISAVQPSPEPFFPFLVVIFKLAFRKGDGPTVHPVRKQGAVRTNVSWSHLHDGCDFCT